MPKAELERRISLGAALALSLLMGARGTGYARVRDLSEPEARDLVIGALDPSARVLPKLAVEPFMDARSPATGFYQFAVTWDNVKGSVVVGFFAVNRATGDVWKSAVCGRVESPGLRRLQDAIRKRIGLARGELRELGAKAPCER